jgi:hypothetical protein
MPLKVSKHCPFCRKAFPTQRAINQHISASKTCVKDWHKKIIRKNDNPSPKRRRINSPDPNLLDDLPHANYYPEPGQQTPSFRATVEDADDEDDSNLTKESGPVRYVEPFPGPAGEASRQEKTRFEVLQQIQESEGKTLWEPFASRAEWGLAEWLMKNVGHKSTDDYLQLPIVSWHFRLKKKLTIF